ncbi:MAG: hypothetical protein ACRD1X_10445 [Vicinamibacteria bacterium]
MAKRGHPKPIGIARELERFVRHHCVCGHLRGDAEALTPRGYRLWIACSCGARFDRWVTLEASAADLLWSTLIADKN